MSAPILVRLAALAPLLGPAPASGAAPQWLDAARSVRVEITHSEAYYASCIPLLDPTCQPDSVTTTVHEDEETAPDAGPWSARAEIAAFPASFAEQDSELGAHRVDAVGSHAGFSHYESQGSFPVTFISEDATTHSAFSATFAIAEATSFALHGDLTTEGGLLSDSTAFVRLVGPGGQVAAETVIASDPGCADPGCSVVGPVPVDASGALVAGTWTLEIGASGTAGGLHSGSGSFGSGHAGAFAVHLQVGDPPPVPVLPAWLLALLPLGILVVARAPSQRPLRGTSRVCTTHHSSPPR